MRKTYDVALWFVPPDGKRCAALTGEVEAAFPLDAVALLMRKYRLSWVAYAAVSLGKGRGVVRFRRGVRMISYVEYKGYSSQGGERRCCYGKRS